MRILHVIRSDGFAGVEAHVLQLAIAQRERGDDVWVIGGDAERMRAGGLDEAGVAYAEASTLVDVVKALRHTRVKRAQVVNAHMTAAEVAACIAGVGPGRLPLIATRHFASVRGSTPLRQMALRYATKGISAQIAVTEYVAAHIDGPSTVVYSGVPERPIALARDRVPQVLVISRLESEKRVDIALEAFAHSELARDGWELVVVGQGAARGALEHRAKILGIGECTRFLGRRADVAALMDRASLLLAPMPYEALGLAVLEAMSCGLAVVAAGSGGHLETVGTASDGALFPPGDIGRASELLRLLAGDETRRCVYGRQLWEVQRTHFTLAAQAEATDAVYRSVL